MVPIFKGKGEAMSCMAYRGVKLLEQAMKIVEKVQLREEIATYGESGLDAIWFYAMQRNDRCSVHSEVSRRVLSQGKEVVYVLR